MKTKLKNWFILFLAALFFTSCNQGSIVDNPPPFLEIVEGPLQGEILTLDLVRFVWRGSGTDNKFRFRLLILDKDNFPTPIFDWTAYSNAITEILFSSLDEGKYRFEVQATSTGITPDPLYREFYIDAVKGPTLLFYKNKTTINRNATTTIDVSMEDIQNLSAFNLVIGFDKSILSLQSVSGGQYIQQNRFQQIVVPDFTNKSILADVNSKGKIEINSALLMDVGSFPNKSVSGSGKIITLTFKGIGVGTTPLDFTYVDIRNSNGVKIPITTPKNGTVVVK
jgi:hypothetical protein